MSFILKGKEICSIVNLLLLWTLKSNRSLFNLTKILLLPTEKKGKVPTWMEKCLLEWLWKTKMPMEGTSTCFSLLPINIKMASSTTCQQTRKMTKIKSVQSHKSLIPTVEAISLISSWQRAPTMTLHGAPGLKSSKSFKCDSGKKRKTQQTLSPLNRYIITLQQDIILSPRTKFSAGSTM